MATKRLKPVPKISKEYLALQDQNPLFDPTKTDARASQELKNIFFKGNGEVLSHNEIVKNIKIYQVSIKWRVLQMLDNLDWTNKKGSPADVFNRSHRTFLKTSQELLTAETDRIPYYRSDLSNPTRLKSAFNSIIIDPTRINNKLLENIGLSQYIPPKGMLREDQTDFRANAIPEIREMFQSLETIEDPSNPTAHSSYNYFRLMRISEGDNQGYVLGTQHIDNKKTLFKTDLYGAERRLLNIEASYEDEIKKLTLIKLQLKDVQENLKFWNHIKHTTKLNDLKEILIECTETLKHVKNEDKQNLKNKIKECLTFKDSTGKDNPTIIRTKLQKAIRYIESRFKNISNIHSYIGKDKAYVTSILESEKLPMSKLVNDIEKYKNDLLILKSPVNIPPHRRKIIINNLEGVLHSVRNIKFQPNLAFCEKVREQIKKVIKNLENNQDEEAKIEFIKAYLIIKIKRAQHQLNEIYKNITVNKNIYHPEVLKQQLESTYELLRGHQIAPDVKIKSYLDEYIKVYQLFDELREKVDLLLNKDNNRESKEDTTSTISFEELLDSFKVRFPKVRGVLGGMKRRVSAYIEKRFDIEIKRASKPKSANSASYTPAEKNETYSEIAGKIKELNFVELMRNIKD